MNGIIRKVNDEFIFELINKMCGYCLADDKYEEGVCACDDEFRFDTTIDMVACTKENCPGVKEFHKMRGV